MSRQLTAQDAELIIQTMHDTLYRVDVSGCLIYASPSAEKLTGFSLQELIGKPVSDLYMHPERRDEFLQRLTDAGGRLNNYEVELRHKDGRGIWVLINVRQFHDQNGHVSGIEGIIRDITSRKLTEEALEYEREKAQVTLRSIADGVITTDLHGRIDYMNPMATTITGWKRAAAKGLAVEEVYQSTVDADDLDAANPVIECLRSGDNVMVANIRLLTRPDGKEFAVRESASPIRNRKGEIIGAVLIIHDVTHLRDMAKQLAFQANHDAQTGLMNRRAFERRIRQALDNSQRTGARHVLCYMDLDQFKVINDTCGHVAGDAMLTQLAGTMASLTRDNDAIARLGGDEFGLLLDSCPLERGIAIAEEIREAVASFRFVWRGKVFEIGVSIGLVVLQQSSGDVTDVLSKADAACFVAKDKGRNRLHVYREEEKGVRHPERQMHWANEIQRAFREDLFCLYTQDSVALAGNDAAAPLREILIRMDNGNEVIPPMAFLPAAERYQLMTKIDRWVVQRTLERLSALHRREALDGVYSINLSASSIADSGFAGFLYSALNDSGLPGEHLCFEIAETAAISNMSGASALVGKLTEQGCRFALDDFGCGLSSLHYLRRLPVQYLKVDAHLIRNVHEDPISLSMVGAINTVAHTMGMKTVAKFVESAEILASLRGIGVDYAQGNTIGIPKPWLQRPGDSS
jgi:Amt family ammonium transporter